MHNCHSPFLNASSADTPLRQATPPTVIPHPHQKVQRLDHYNDQPFLFSTTVGNGDTYQHSQYSPPPRPFSDHNVLGSAPFLGNNHREDTEAEVLAREAVTELNSLPFYPVEEQQVVEDCTLGNEYTVLDPMKVMNETTDILSQSMSIAFGTNQADNGLEFVGPNQYGDYDLNGTINHNNNVINHPG